MSAAVGPDLTSDGLVCLVDPGSTFASKQGLTYLLQRRAAPHPANSANFDTYMANGTILRNGLHEDEINWGNTSQLTRWGTRVKYNPEYLRPTDASLGGWHDFIWSVSGHIYMPVAGTYSVIADGDDAFEVWVNNQIVSSWYGGHGFNGATIPINVGITDTDLTISAPGWYPFMARMTEGFGGQGLAVAWKKPGDSVYATIPVENYRPFSVYDKAANVYPKFVGTGPQTKNNVFVGNGTDAHIEIQDESIIKPPYVSVSTWAYLDNWNTAARYCIVSKTEGGGYQIGLNDTGTYGNGYLGWLARINGVYRNARIPLSQISSGWHNITGTYDGRYMKIYLDGVLENTYDNGSIYPIQYPVPADLIIGAEPNGTASVTSAFFAGEIGSTAVYNKALSDADVYQNFIALRKRYGV